MVAIEESHIAKETRLRFSSNLAHVVDGEVAVEASEYVFAWVRVVTDSLSFLPLIRHFNLTHSKHTPTFLGRLYQRTR